MSRLARIAGASLGGAATLGMVVLGGFAAATALATRRAEAASPPEGRFVEVDGARLHYVDRGAGPAIVLVHGLGGQLRNFTFALTDRLAADFRVVAVDRPGSGYSTPAPGTDPTLAGQAALIAAFIRAIGLDRPLLVGHSLGGAIALALALDHPDAISGVALISPLTQRQDDIPPAFRGLIVPSARLRRFLSRTVAVPIGRRKRKIGEAMIFAPDQAPDDFETRGGGGLMLRPDSFFAASSEASAGSDELDAMTARYAGLRVPAAILFGRDDAILDPARHGIATAALLPDTRCDLMPGGHMIPVTAPTATADWIAAQALAFGNARTPAPPVFA